MYREALLEQIRARKIWDLIVIGGGATGLGVAVDAATRGYATLLLEAIDFAKGTSSRSTKLVHGGVRYLAQGNIALVYDALRERGRRRAARSQTVSPRCWQRSLAVMEPGNSSRCARIASSRRVMSWKHAMYFDNGGKYETRRAARPAWLVKEGESRPAAHFAPQLAPCSTSHRYYCAPS